MLIVVVSGSKTTPNNTIMKSATKKPKTAFMTMNVHDLSSEYIGIPVFGMQNISSASPAYL
jgi:cell division septal protein FtsQ